MQASSVGTLGLLLIALGLPGCHPSVQQSRKKPRDDAGRVTVVAVQSKSVTIKRSYPCRVGSQRCIQVCAPAEGRLAEILVKEGRVVRRGDLLFRVGPPRDEAKPEAEDQGAAVSINAPCDGLLVGPLSTRRDSRVRKGERLATLSDAGGASVEFGMPEKDYLSYMAERGDDWRSPHLELTLADHGNYPHAGQIVEILASFHNETGDINVRADFPNPDGLLRQGRAGTLTIILELKDAILIPRRAAFLDHPRWCVYVVGKDRVAHRREIVIHDEAEDDFVAKGGVGVGERIVLDGVEHVREGDKVE